MKDILPLFTVLTKDGEVKRVVPKVTDGKQTFKAGKMISNLAKAIEGKVKEIAQGDDVGMLTIGAYVLMETLMRSGQGSQVTLLQANQSILQQAAFFTAIGILAGREIPEGVRFETATADGDINLRELPKRTNREKDESPSSGSGEPKMED